jgi:hypothetical protein
MIPSRRSRTSFSYKNQPKINISLFASCNLFSSFVHLLSPSLGSLGPSWRPCCSPKASFGVPLALSGGILASLGAHLGALGSTLALPKPPLASSEVSFGLLWAPLGSIGCLQLHFGSPMGNFDLIFGPSWSILVSVGPILVSICL